MKRYILEVRIEGVGNVPEDMLRYDHCWPATSEDSLHVDIRDWPTKRQVLLHMMYQGIRERCHPTIDRWKSFGWNVIGYRIIS